LFADRVTDSEGHYVLDVNNLAEGWQQLAPLPQARNHLSSALIGDVLYAIGGHFGHDNGVQELALVHAYDTQTDTWTRVADLPFARSHFEPGTFVQNGKIIIVGGRQGDENFFNNITEYDPILDTWTDLCTLPELLLAPSAKVINGELIVANGAISSIFSVTANVWRTQFGNISPPLIAGSSLFSSLDETIHIDLSPNPSSVSTTLTYNTATNSEISEIYVFDISGRLVRKYSGSDTRQDKGNYQLNVELMEAGIYLMKIWMEDRSENPLNAKMIIKR